MKDINAWNRSIATKYFETQRKLGKLFKKINTYRLRELNLVKNEFEFKIYLNRLNIHVRNDIDKMSLKEAKEMSKSIIDEFEKLTFESNVLNHLRNSIYGDYSGEIF